MSETSDPTSHQRLERQFIAHVERLLIDDRLRVRTAKGRKPVTILLRDVNPRDKGVDLKRLLSEMGRPDRQLEASMPVGKGLDVALSTRKWWLFKSPVGRLQVRCVSPARALIAGDTPAPMSGGEFAKLMSEVPPPLPRIPVTTVVMSTSGFTPAAVAAAEASKDRPVILVNPTFGGGWTVTGPDSDKDIIPLFDPEADLEKRERIRDEIEANRVDLTAGGLASDKVAAKLGVAPRLVEDELKSYAKENAGLAAKRLDGRMVLFREGASPLAASSKGADMPFIDRMRFLFARKGEVEKKIAFLSERRTVLTQQLDRGYEEMSAMEGREAALRTQFKEASGDLTRRRVTSQLLQMRKDIERRQQLLSMLNQQINVVSTHLHNLELQRQGETAHLPDSDEMAQTAADAEEVLAELQAGSELAESVGAMHGGMSEEEQALYDELLKDSVAPAPGETGAESTGKSASPGAAQAGTAGQASASKPPPVPQRNRAQPEAG
jgi:hypothetical protein